MKPLVKNAADPKQVERAGHKQRYNRKMELEDVRDILETPAGRRTFWRYLTECRVFGSVFNNSGSMTYFNEGRRDVGLKIMADITEANDEAYLLMMREAKDREFVESNENESRETKESPEGE